MNEEKRPLNKVIVTVLDGAGMPKQIAVEVPDDATHEQIKQAVEKAEREA